MTRRDIDLIASAKALQYGVPPELVSSVISAESSYNPNAIGPVTKYGSAYGLMQLLPSTASELGVSRDQILDPERNIDAGTRYLRQLYDRYGSWDVALAAYNAGPGTVDKYGGAVPPYKETRNYVQKILDMFSLKQPAVQQGTIYTDTSREVPTYRMTVFGGEGDALPWILGIGLASVLYIVFKDK